jgi:Mn2+/Fe2+ NRAMP family transporter
MIIASSRNVMGHLRERRGLLAWGWIATAVMAVASAAMLIGNLSG